MTDHKNSIIQHGKKLNFLEWTTVKISKSNRHSTAFPLSVKLVIKLEVRKFSLQMNQLIYPLMIFFVFFCREDIDLFAYMYPYITGDSDQFSLFNLSALTCIPLHVFICRWWIKLIYPLTVKKMIYPIMIYWHYHIVSWEISSWQVWRFMYHYSQP